MKKILFQIANYSDNRQQIYDNWFSPRNREYAEHHEFEYRSYDYFDLNGRSNPIWGKLYRMQEILKECSNGDKISVLDADMVVVDGKYSFETDFSFGYAIDSGNTHCLGSYTITVNSWSRQLIDLLLCEERYQKYQNNAMWKMWAEQASWYALASIPRHSWIPFWSLPNNGWGNFNHQDKNELSIAELYSNVELFETAWNVTIIKDESPAHLWQYLINDCDKKRMIMRHFAGTRDWSNGINICKKELRV